MRNAVIATVLIVLLVLAGVTIYSIEGKTTRQNELDANLSTAMKSSMEIMTIDPKYTIDRENDEHLIADFIQNFLVKMNSNSKFDIEILGVDSKKGLLSVRATETYNTIFGKSNVSAERTVILEDYHNTKNEYYEVTFYMTYTDGEYKDPIKQVHVYGGSTLEDLSPNKPVQKGYTFKGWKLAGYENLRSAYADFSKITVTSDMKFVADWQKDADGVHTVLLYANNELHAIKKVNSGKALGTVTNAPAKSGYTFTGWSSKEGELLTEAQLEKQVIKEHKTYIAMYKKK